jgi:hypothetical protein
VDIDPEEEARRKKTMVLLAGGALSLVLPLLGVLYLRWSETRAAPKQTDAAVFQQREAAEKRITLPSAPAMAAAVAYAQPAQVPAAAPGPGSLPMPSAARAAAEGNGSLGFIKPSGDYYAEKKPEPAPEPKKEEVKPVAAKATPAPKAAKAAKAKPGKKAFVMPKLNTAKGFTSFKRNQPAQKEAPPPGEDAPADMSDLMKNLPPGAANNPDIQKYFKQNQ